MTAEPFDPLIVTVSLDPLSQAQFDRLRERHFPPSLNVLSAHVTLFHHLPGAELAAIDALLASECSALPPCPFSATHLRFLGRGTAYVLDMPEVAALRDRLAAACRPWLTPQDRQAWRPHVTVQNKVPGPEAKRVFGQLQAGFVPFTGVATGLHLWAYLGGPWQSLGHKAFTSLPLAASQRNTASHKSEHDA